MPKIADVKEQATELNLKAVNNHDDELYRCAGAELPFSSVSDENGVGDEGVSKGGTGCNANWVCLSEEMNPIIFEAHVEEDKAGACENIEVVGDSFEANENSTSMKLMEGHAGRSLKLELNREEAKKVISEDLDVSITIFDIPTTLSSIPHK